MSPYTLSILLSSLSVGTIITATSSHWFLAWVGLEMNTLAMIPLMTKAQHPRATEAATKYFLMQTLASAMFLFSTAMNAWHTGEWTIEMQTTAPTLMLTMALMIKMAIFPFHLWLPDVMQGLDMLTCLILSTWQKLAPMTLIIQISQELSPMLLVTMSILSIITGGWGGLNQPQLRKVMAYSSIAHLGWMIAVLSFSKNLMLLTLLMYIIMTSSMFFMLIYLSSTNINKLAISWVKNLPLTFMMMMILMSLGGLPPMSGFLPKWLIIEEITKQNMMMLIMLMTISALLSLFFYLRLSYTSSLTSPPTPINSKIYWRLKNKHNQTMALTIIMSIMLLPVSPMILNLF